MSERDIEVVTVTLNPAIDLTLTVPHFTAGGVNRVESLHARPGGKGVNVASALADFGHAVAVSGFLGGENGATFEALFAEKGIEDHFLRTGGETRTGVKIFDPAQGHTTDINFPGQPVAAGDVDSLLERLRSLAARGRPWFVLAGSLPPGAAPETYRDLVRALKAEGCRVLLDTSGAPLGAALAAGPHVIKPNLRELEWLLGARLAGHGEVAGAARALLVGGVELAAVSMGSEGALFVTADETLLARAPEVRARSTVGAGDAMAAGIIAGRLAGLAPAEVARLATAFSLDLLTREDASAFSRERVNGLMREVTVERHDAGS